MANEKKTEFEIVEINETMIQSKIYLVRNQKIMLDFELAEIYGYTTTRFNEQVKNNIEKFDDDFMFELTKEEFQNLMSKKSTSSWGGRITSILEDPDRMKYDSMIKDLLKNNQLVLK